MLTSFISTLAGFFLLPSLFGLFGVASAASGDLLSGYAWSPNTGWISLNCTNASCGSSNYGVTVSGAGVSKTLSGYAWSSSLGWISFNSSDLAGCPSGTCSATMNTTSGLGGGEIAGWAKALSANGSQSGGWGGWIKLRGSSYGVLANGTKWTGFAWGGGPVTGTGVFSPQTGGNAETGWISFRGLTPLDPTSRYYGVSAATSTNAEGPRSISCGVNVWTIPRNTNVTWSVVIDSTKLPGPYTYVWDLPDATSTYAVSTSIVAQYVSGGTKHASVIVTVGTAPNDVPYVVDCDAATVAGAPSPWYPYVTIIGYYNLDATVPIVSAGPYRAGVTSVTFNGDIFCYDGVGADEDCDTEPLTQTFNNVFVVDMGASPSRDASLSDWVPAQPPVSYLLPFGPSVPVSSQPWPIPGSACPAGGPACTANLKLCADQSLSPNSAKGVVCEPSVGCEGNYSDNNCSTAAGNGWVTFTVEPAPFPDPEGGACKATPAVSKVGSAVTWSVTPGSIQYGTLPFHYVWTSLTPGAPNDLPATDSESIQKTYTTGGTKRAHVKVTDSESPIPRELEFDCSGSARIQIFEEF